MCARGITKVPDAYPLNEFATGVKSIQAITLLHPTNRTREKIQL